MDDVIHESKIKQLGKFKLSSHCLNNVNDKLTVQNYTKTIIIHHIHLLFDCLHRHHREMELLYTDQLNS